MGAETLCFDYKRSHDVDIRVVRIFNTYGPGMHPFDGRVTSNFIVQALAGEDITLYGDGSQTRSFCFVDDLIGGIVKFMYQEEIHGPMNLGNPNEVTGSKSKIVYLPLPGDDPKQRRPDITIARKNLDWEPKVQLREGVTKTAEYFKSLDMRKFKKPTPHTAHKNTDAEPTKIK